MREDTKRRAVLKLLRRGMITPAEAARLAQTSRQLVRYWLQQAQIDVDQARARYLSRVWPFGHGQG